MARYTFVQHIQLSLIFATLVTISLTACSPSSPQPNDPEQTLHISIGAAPQALDPHLISGVPAMKVVTALFEPLLVMNTTTLQPEPGLAESWEVNSQGMVLRFRLRANARWSDGQIITANDIVATWQRIFSPNIAHPFAQDYYAIAGAAAFHRGETSHFGDVGVKAVSDNVVEFTLAYPDPLFLKRLTHASSSPIQPANLESYTELDNPVSTWTQGSNMVGNGAFKLVDWQLNKVIVAVKNPHYWDADNVTLEKIVFYPIENINAEERMFRAGQLHAVYGGQIPPEKIQHYRDNAPDKLVITPGYATYYYDFNTQRAPFDNLDVRRAFSYAVDRELIIKRIAKAGQMPAYTLTPRDGRYSVETPIDFNPALAKTLLEKAGYPNGKGFPPVTLYFNTHEGHRKVSVALQQMWKKHLNVDVQLQNQEWKVFLSTRREHQFHIARDGFSSTYADPMDLLAAFTTNHEMNTAAWSNAEYDELLNKAKSELDSDKRMALLAQAETLFTDQVPVFPIYYYAYSYLVSPGVKGMSFNSIEIPNYKNISIDTNVTKGQ